MKSQDVKQLLSESDEYSYQRYGIGALDIICGGDMNEFFMKWYDGKIGTNGIRRLIDERADKYGLTVIDEFV